ncbi:hypothetical protein [Methylovulum psychrotolerans]|uniref:Calcium-binding protein n=1 Tax=Methylovulum psychrotolerans TaxID=1704499 RepID=A0A2S5CHW1_9GAMM|nr:hypothetical protein [Methylovulum psychrotolerans]POZ50391.1 calcium-binding protein [Methylovulum psychrotolerans]
MNEQTAPVNTAPSFIIHTSPIITDFGADDTASSVVIQKDGKIVVAGTYLFDQWIWPGWYTANVALVRYNSDGSLDTSFSGDGQLLTTMSENSFGDSAVIQPDGKIIVAGTTGYFNDFNGNQYDFALARYNTDGSLDTGFSGDGLVATTFIGSLNMAYCVALQSDGKILATGKIGYDPNDPGVGSYDFGLARYNSDGSLDTSFSGDGLVTTDLGFDADAATTILVQANGKIVVGGTTGIVRYNSDGSLDTSFSGDGKLLTGFSVNSATLLPNGKLLAAGDTTIARYNSDGSLDTGFSGDGKVISAVAITSAALQANGKLVVAGGYSLARYNSDGSLDLSFSGDGKASSSFNITRITLQADGKIIAAGNGPMNMEDFSHDFATARYNSDGSLDKTFGTPRNSLGNTVATQENALPVIIAAHVQISDAELDALNFRQGNYSGASLTLLRHGGANPDDLFSGAGTLRLSNGSVTLNGQTIGSYQNDAGQLSLHFAAATTQQVNNTLHQLAYRNGSEQPPTAVQLDWTFNDGNSSQPLTATGSTTLTITPANDAPNGFVFINGTFALGQPLSASNNITDPDGLGTISYQWQSRTDSQTWGNLTTSTDLVLNPTILNHLLKLTASYTDDQGFQTSVYSIQGTNGNDVIWGGSGNQRLSGGDGNDSLLGGAGDDALSGGNGTDIAQYYTATAAVTVNLGLLIAQNTIGAGTDSLSGIENLNGSAYNDILLGNAANNSLYGGAGDDRLSGSDGNDSLVGGLGNDVLNGGNGLDVAQYYAASAGVTVNLALTTAQNTVGAGTDTLLAIEAVNGSAFNDTLIGNAAANSLWGGAGNDVLDGGLGNDFLKGGLGQDIFVFDTALGPNNKDILSDFKVSDDTIRLENAIFTALPHIGVLATDQFKILGNGGAADSSDRILYNTVSGGLFYDADGNGADAAVLVAVLGKGLAMTAADFLVA